MFAGYNPFGPANIVDNTFTFTNDLSWTRGKHSLKFGFYASAYRDAMIYAITSTASTTSMAPAR